MQSQPTVSQHEVKFPFSSQCKASMATASSSLNRHESVSNGAARDAGTLSTSRNKGADGTLGGGGAAMHAPTVPKQTSGRVICCRVAEHRCAHTSSRSPGRDRLPICALKMPTDESGSPSGAAETAPVAPPVGRIAPPPPHIETVCCRARPSPEGVPLLHHNLDGRLLAGGVHDTAALASRALLRPAHAVATADRHMTVMWSVTTDAAVGREGAPLQHWPSCCWPGPRR